MLGRYIQFTCLAARGPSDGVGVEVEVGVGVEFGVGVIAATRKITAPSVLCLYTKMGWCFTCLCTERTTPLCYHLPGTRYVTRWRGACIAFGVGGVGVGVSFVDFLCFFVLTSLLQEVRTCRTCLQQEDAVATCLVLKCNLKLGPVVLAYA